MLNSFLNATRNYYTTLAGLVAGVGAYLMSVGLTLPTTKEEAKHFIISLAMVVLGISAKDATTGSQVK